MDSLRIVLAALCFTYVIATGPQALTIETPDKSELSVGETLTLTCLVPGHDEPSWYKDGMPITAVDRIAIENMHDGENTKSKLTVSSLVAADGGAYKCAFVPGIDESDPVRIIVSEAAAVAGGSVEIEEPDVETLHINIGATFNLKCRADAGVSISWQKDGVTLTDSDENYIINKAELPTGAVILLSPSDTAQESDSGVFTCLNDKDAADSDEVTVHVANEHEHGEEEEKAGNEEEEGGHEHEEEEGADGGASMVTTFTLPLLLACLAALL